MNRHIFVLIRYSVLSLTRSKGWVIGRQDFAAYRNELFNAERLRAREFLFKNVTLPSFAAQRKADVDWTLLLVTSSELPADALERLQKIIAPFRWIKLVQMPPEKVDLGGLVLEAVGSWSAGGSYATVRIDDDDAVAGEFLSQLERYVRPEYDAHAVTFARGCAGIFQGGAYKSFLDYYYPMNSAGLAYVRSFRSIEQLEGKVSVYGLGPHHQVDRQGPLIVDARRHMYIRTLHSWSDASSTGLVKKARALSQLIPADEILRNFGINPEVVEMKCDAYSRFSTLSRCWSWVPGRRRASPRKAG